MKELSNSSIRWKLIIAFFICPLILFLIITYLQTKELGLIIFAGIIGIPALVLLYLIPNTKRVLYNKEFLSIESASTTISIPVSMIEQVQPRVDFSQMILTRAIPLVFYDIDLKEPSELGTTISFLVRDPEEQLPRIEELRGFIYDYYRRG